MDKQQAQAIIKNTFESPFDKVRFTNFIKNLLNSIDELKAFHAHGYVKEGFSGIIKTYERIGTYNSTDDKKVDIIIVYLQKGFSLDHARVTQRNFAGRYLVDRGEKDAGLFAFVSPDETDWRFSLVKMDYKFEKTKTGRMKVKEEFTPARRWSFLVGANEKSHTAQSQMVKILADDEHDPTVAELEQAFDIETVTKEFFEKYRELFLRTKEELDRVVKKDPKIKADFEDNGVDTVNFAKKLLGQIVFLYFLQKKGWFGVGRNDDWGTGSKHFLRELFDKKHGDYKNFFNDILEPLFYEALRTGEDRKHEDYYYSRFNCKIPFLNGGLFDPIGNYDWVKTDIIIPDKLFSNQTRTKEGDTGTGILDVFDRYNFTVKEDEPLEKEVAIDPELLGKSYEKFNAIRPDNYDEFKKALKSGKKGEENKFNKKFGVYYTPREIVHYMCQQSLINYLNSELNSESSSYQKLGDSQLDMFGNKAKKGQLDLTIEHKAGISIRKEDIETLIHAGEQFSENEARVLRKGKETKTYSHKLPESIRQNAELIDEKLADITVCDPAVGSGAFPVGMMNEIVRARNVLSTFMQDNTRTPYEFKRRCIEHSLYGVDIDPGAVEIAKLRLWLSLVVDEQDIKNIKPLPNLDYKIVCGNSLLGYPYTPMGLEKIEKLKQYFLNETNPSKKNEFRRKIDEAIYSLYENTEKSIGYKVTMDFKINFSEVFHHKGGFDVVIGNPPYVEHKKLKSLSSQLKSFYSIYSGTADLYVYFYEKGVKILRQNGILVFITSNKFIKTRYGQNLRKYFVNYRINELIDFTDVHVFEALVASCIFSISKNEFTDNKIKIAFANDLLLNFSDLSEFVDKNCFLMSQNNLSEKIWQLENETKLALKEKIEEASVTFKETRTINIYRGVTTGYNPAFIIDEEKRKKLIKEDKANEAIIKPLLQGRNVRKWSFIKSTESLLFIPWHFPLQDDPSITGASLKAEKEIKNNYRSLYSHLKSFKEDLSNRNKDETGIRYEWYALQRCAASYYPEFEKEKIIWGLTANKWAFAYDNEKYYLPSNGYILTSKEIPIKYLLALMNSSLMEFYFRFIGIMTAGGAFTLKHETIAVFPIKIKEKYKQQKFIELVDHILFITKDDDYSQNSQKQTKLKSLETEIDQLVYKLYNLTPEEIKIVEGGI